jgi:acyl carrier protein
VLAGGAESDHPIHDSGGSTVAEQSQEEHQLACLIVDALNLEGVEPADIDPAQPLFDGGLNLDSIDALEIAVVVAQKYGVHLRAEDEGTKSIFSTLRSLSVHIHRQVGLREAS